MAKIVDLADVRYGKPYYLEIYNPYENKLCKVELNGISRYSNGVKRYAGYDLLTEDQALFHFSYTYNDAWRLWDTRPTEAERDAAVWESDELPF